ncbi:MAG TPA: MBL fold metallo-hydrolase, partial [Rhizobiales bacterium]|nr:MBL fold metallo-hydrolase [Hyphomicrobiales bacterium]
MSALEVYQFGCRTDNFGILVHDSDIGVTASIDAPDEAAINAALDEKGWTLSHILVTHHHYDHVDGIDGLKRKWGAIVLANRDDVKRIPGVDIEIAPGSSFDFASH